MGVPLLLRSSHHLFKLSSQFFCIRLFFTDFTAQIIQIIQLVKVTFPCFYQPDLCNNLPFRCLCRNLDIAWYNKNIILYKSITSANTVQTVLQTKVLRSTSNHSLPNVQDPLYNSLVIVFHIHFPFPKTSLFCSSYKASCSALPNTSAIRSNDIMMYQKVN